MKKIIIGLTGGIGSGKSAAADILLQLGAYIIDADVVAKQVLEGEANQLIKQAFPQCVLNGTLNRKQLKEVVFSSKENVQKLNAITHPIIFKHIDKQLKEGLNVIVAPLLFESGFNKLCHATVAVVADKNSRLERVCQRDNVNKQAVESIMNAQINQQQLMDLSDFVILNNADLPSLKEKVEQWYKNIQKLYFG